MPFGNFGDRGPSDPATKAFVVTPSDSTEFKTPTAGLYIGGTGNVNVVMRDDTATTLFSTVPAGTILPISVKQVYSTSTTATTIVALWG